MDPQQTPEPTDSYGPETSPSEGLHTVKPTPASEAHSFSTTQLNTSPLRTVPAPAPPAPVVASAPVTFPHAPARVRVSGTQLKLLGIVLLALVLLGAGAFALLTRLTVRDESASSAALLAKDFNVQDIPLEGLVSTSDFGLATSQSLSVNGQLRANNSLILTPGSQPTNATAGQMYYDQTGNVLAYYNGTRFVSLSGSDQLDDLTTQLQSVAARIPTTAIPTDLATLNAENSFTRLNTFTGGLATESLSVAQATSLQGSLTVSGVTTLGPTVISSLILTTPLGVTSGGTGSNSLTQNGILIGQGTNPITSLTASGPNLCLMSTAGAPAFSACPGGGASVTSLNGLTGDLTLAGATAIGTIITLNDATTTSKGIASFNATNFTVTSGAVNTIQDIATSSSPTFNALSLTTALSIGNGGTGSTTAAGARTNLGAAASGANTDITSLAGLTTALTIGQGGTGATTSQAAINNVSQLTTNGDILYYNGTNSTRLARGSSGDCLTSNATTILWGSCGLVAEADTLATVTGRGATTATAVLLQGGATIRGATIDTATATDDRIVLSVTTGGIARFDGTITSADLTANRTYTLADSSGTFITTGNLTSITGTGALAVGSIASGFGTISTGNTISGTQLTSTVATGTAPMTVASTTKVTGLNADLLDGLDSTAFGDATAANQTTILSRIGTNADAAGTTTVFARLASIDTSKLGDTSDAANATGSIFARLAYLITSIGATTDAASSTGSVNAKLAYIIANSGSKSQYFAEFTTSTSWTAPAGVTTVEVFVVGGGGGGGNGYSNGNTESIGGGGGGGGGVIKKMVSVIPGNNYTITIGAGGAGAVAAGNGSAGSSSVFGGLTASGGLGGFGQYDRAGGNPGPGGGGGGSGGYHYQSGTTTYFRIAGLNGSSGTDGYAGGGAGSGAYLSRYEPEGTATDGGGAAASNGNAAPNAPANRGGGGGGAIGNTGGAGGSGYLLIKWWQ